MAGAPLKAAGSMTRQEQINSFLAQHGYGDVQQQPLAGDASFRRYIRLVRGTQSYMLMDAPPAREDVRPYVAIAEYLCAAGYSAPRIIARDVEAGFLLLEDLADDTFSSVLRRDSSAEQGLYEAAIDLLVSWHKPDTLLADPVRLPLPMYDEALLMRELALFSEWYLEKTNPAQAKTLGAEFLELWRGILRANPLEQVHFVHRDYHADNLMWLTDRSGDARVGLLDFQDGVYGDAAYDLVSLLEDARRDVPPALSQALLARYIERSGVDAQAFKVRYAILGAQRNCKIIGIFVRLCMRDGKAHYLKFLPRVWKHLEHDVSHPALSSLRVWLDAHIPSVQRGELSA